MEIFVLRAHDPYEPCDVVVLPHWKDAARPKGGAFSDVSARMARQGFSGKLGETLSIPVPGTGVLGTKVPGLNSKWPLLKAEEYIVIGLGDKKGADADRIRLFGAHLATAADAANAQTVVVSLEAIQKSDIRFKDAVLALAEGILLANYRFHKYHGTQTKKEPVKSTLKRICLMVPDARTAQYAEESVRAATILADGIHLARDLVNTPPSDMTPSALVSAAASLAEGNRRIRCNILSADEMTRLGMGAALAVSRGSEHAPAGVHLTYSPKGKSRKTVAIVGKAVTFDSGGLSLKPAKSMETMKCDMAGAAAVVGLFRVLADAQPDVTVHGIFLAAENMPGTGAFRPGDIVTAMDGTTVEILNTDAEGRLMLADALAYATTVKPDYLIDLATLTGACVVALGDDIAAMLANDARLAARIRRASDETGERVWELPLHADYAKQMKSKVADLRNISAGSGAGTITAALFLQPFVKNIPWAHVDIAGPAYRESSPRPDIPYGGTGFGVRLLARFLQTL